MVASPPTYHTVIVSGVNGSNPICKKISFKIPASNTTEQIYDVSNNNPNSSYSNVAIDYNGYPYLNIKLYDGQNNIIAQMDGVRVPYP